MGHRRATRLDGDEGAAVAEFVLVSALFALVAMAVLQIGFAVYLRNTLLQCAVEGARYGGRADVTPAEGAQRARELAAGFSGARADDVQARSAVVGGVEVVEVRISTSLPVLATFGPSGGLTVVGRAYEESQ